MTNKPSALTANDFDVMINLAERELATRRAIVEIESRPDGSAYRRRKARKEIKVYEAHIETLKQRRLEHV